MSNLLNTAESSVNDVEIELKAYDAALEPVKSKQIEIFELEQAHQNNTSDISADFRTRLKIHSANSSALVLHRADTSVFSVRHAQSRRQGEDFSNTGPFGAAGQAFFRWRRTLLSCSSRIEERPIFFQPLGN
jgi:hypothetical protein